MPADGTTDNHRLTLPPPPPPQPPPPNGNSNGIIPLQVPTNSNYRLRLNPHQDHKPDSYDDLQSEFTPLLFSSLEKYLPHNMLNVSRESKHRYMREILRRYSDEGERNRIKKHNEYRQRIISNYQPLYRDIYQMNATTAFFVPSFIQAFATSDSNRDERIRNIMSEPAPGVYTFNMLQPGFCEMLLAEVANFEKWIHETRFRIMRPNTMNKFGAVLNDFGMEPMLEKLMDDFIRHISRIFFADVGGFVLDSHHGFVVEYGYNRDIELLDIKLLLLSKVKTASVKELEGNTPCYYYC